MALDPVTVFLQQYPPAQRKALQAVRTTILKALPGAEEGIAWGMPAYRIDGDLVISFCGFVSHNSIFPAQLRVQEVLAKELVGYEKTKATIHFDPDRGMPATLLRKILRVIVEEINRSYPRKNQVMKQFYVNGRLKAKGRMKDGQKVGVWRTYAADGRQLT